MMTPEEFERYRNMEPVDSMIRIEDLGHTGYNLRGTLAYGYTVDRDTWHAYIHGGLIHVITFKYNAKTLLSHIRGIELPVESMRPNKRVYPESVDFVFAILMRDRGFQLPFTTFGSANWEYGTYAGKIHLDFALN